MGWCDGMAARHKPVTLTTDYFPITAHPEMFYSSYSKAVCHGYSFYFINERRAF